MTPTLPRLQRLNRDLLASGCLTSDVELPDGSMFDLPETVVQFGTGAFLRGFVDFFLDEAIRDGAFDGRVVAIGSTGSGRDSALNAQDGLYTILVEGTTAARAQRVCRVIGSVSRGVNAEKEWDEVLALARQPRLDFLFSNTTEIGIALGDGDLFDAAPPPSFPAKLTRFLVERARALDFEEGAGPVVIPCELIERNGEKLRELVLTLAHRWRIDARFAKWLDRAVPFCNTLVDRIVPGRPSDSRRIGLESQLGYRDELMIAAEPYRLFAIQSDAPTRRRLGFAAVDDGIVLTDDVTPFRERKVRILNGGHTIMASVGLLIGCNTVLDAMQHPLIGAYVQRLLLDEIVPSLDVGGGKLFAQEVLGRFGNPYLRHSLRDITLQHTAKVRVRVVPSIVRFAEQKGAAPRSLAFGFAAYLLLSRAALGTRGTSPGPAVDSEGEVVRALWRDARDDSDATLRHVASAVCRHVELWQTDLTRVPGFVDRVAEQLVRISRDGIASALGTHLGDAAMTTASSKRP